MMLIGVLFAGVTAGCTEETASAPPADPALRAAFEREQQPWREQRRASLTAPDGWTTLTGLHWLEPGAHYVGSAGDNGIRLSVGPEQFGMIEVRNSKVRLVPHRGVALTADGAPLRGQLVLRADDHPDGPTRIGFDDGKGVAMVLKRGERYALRVKHADAPTRTGFGTLEYWPGGPEWIVDARFEPHPPGRTIEVASIVGTLEAQPNPGAVVFAQGGNEYRLEALEGEDGGFFLIFADRTSGHGSYGAGRYIDTAAPTPDGRLRVDFNHAYNPPCAFTPFATCPLPPPENRLDLAVQAGEKAYAGQH